MSLVVKLGYFNKELWRIKQFFTITWRNYCPVNVSCIFFSKRPRKWKECNFYSSNLQKYRAVGALSWSPGEHLLLYSNHMNVSKSHKAPTIVYHKRITSQTSIIAITERFQHYTRNPIIFNPVKFSLSNYNTTARKLAHLPTLYRPIWLVPLLSKLHQR